MKDWWRRFFAADNSVNEQTVIGVYWVVVASLLMVTKIIFPERVGLDMVVATLSASLLCFGISGFKRS